MLEKEMNERDMSEIIDKCMFDCYTMCGIW